MNNFNDLYKHLTKKIPIEESFASEPYGKYNCNNLKNVKKILYCVTPSSEIDDYFIKNNYDLLISHHIGNSSVPYLIFHTALDFCKGGLTDYWNDIIQIKNPKRIVKNAGLYGDLNEPILFTDLVKKLDIPADGIIGLTDSKIELIKSVAICSGFGALIQRNVEDLNVDCYILGQTFNNFNLHDSHLKSIIELGHTKSERIGVHCLRKMIEDFDPSIEIDVAPLEIDIYGNEASCC